MAITLHLTPEQEAKLRPVATQLRVSPEALAEAAVRDLLPLPDDAFLKVAEALVELRGKVQGAEHWQAANAHWEVAAIRRVL